MNPQAAAQALKDRISDHFLRDRPDSGVSAVGVGLDDQGRHAVVVHLNPARADARPEVLNMAQGHPVVFVDEGPIMARGGAARRPV